MKILVRTGRPADLESIIEAQSAMALETEGLALDPARLRQGVQGVFDRPGRGTYWIAESDGRPAGMLLAVPEWSDWRNRDIWWIHSVYTWPEFRGQGVYKALYQHLRQQVLDEENLGGLRLYVETKNYRAQKVYEKLGMSKEHYLMYEWLK